MIGVFDSGLGGVQTLRYLVEKFPQYTYCYLGDSAWLPYGNRQPQRIHDRTFSCAQWLFAQGCKLIILACNSASTYAIRSRQEQFPNHKMLSVTLPGVEAVVAGNRHRIGVLGTQATIQSNLYPSFFGRHFPDYPCTIEQGSGGDLVMLIEQDAPDEIIEKECQLVVGQFSKKIEALVLGCTHYPIIESILQKNLSSGVVCINPALEAAKKLGNYLSVHYELEAQLDHTSKVFFYTTGEQTSSSTLGSRIRGAPYTVSTVHI